VKNHSSACTNHLLLVYIVHLSAAFSTTVLQLKTFRHSTVKCHHTIAYFRHPAVKRCSC